MSRTPPSTAGDGGGGGGGPVTGRGSARQSPGLGSLKLPPTSLNRMSPAAVSQSSQAPSSRPSQQPARALVLPPSSLAKVAPPPLPNHQVGNNDAIGQSASSSAGNPNWPTLPKLRPPRTSLPVEAMTIPVVDQAAGAKRTAAEAGLDSVLGPQPSLSYDGKRTMHEILEQIDPNERLDEVVEEVLLEVADEFIDSVTRFACHLAKHRKCDTVEVKDLQLHLDQNWNIRIPGFASDEIRYHRKPVSLPGYAQQAAAVRKAQSLAKAAAAPAGPSAAAAAPQFGAANVGSRPPAIPGELPPASTY